MTKHAGPRVEFTLMQIIVNICNQFNLFTALLGSMSFFWEEINVWRPIILYIIYLSCNFIHRVNEKQLKQNHIVLYAILKFSVKKVLPRTISYHRRFVHRNYLYRTWKQKCYFFKKNMRLWWCKFSREYSVNTKIFSSRF